MGGVQAKPERRRPGLERKTSFARNQRAIPIITSDPTDDLSCKYQADCKELKDLILDADELSTRSEEVIRNRSRLVFSSRCVEYLMKSNEKSVTVILSLTKQIFEAKGKKVMKANEKLIDQLLIRDFFNYTKQILQLCTQELQQFIKSSREVHSCFADVVRKREASKKLDESIKEYRDSAEEVVKEVNTLIDIQKDMLNKLNERIQNFNTNSKLQRDRTLKKILNVVFIGIMSGLFVCTIMATAMAAPVVSSALTAHHWIAEVVAIGAVAYACSPVLKEGRHWLLTLIQGHESSLKAHKGVIETMEAKTRDSEGELKGILSHVKKLIAKGNDPVLANLGSANADQEVMIITEKLLQFDQEIEELKKRREDCLIVTQKARDRVLKEYGELKSSERWGHA